MRAANEDEEWPALNRWGRDKVLAKDSKEAPCCGGGLPIIGLLGAPDFQQTTPCSRFCSGSLQSLSCAYNIWEDLQGDQPKPETSKL